MLHQRYLNTLNMYSFRRLTTTISLYSDDSIFDKDLIVVDFHVVESKIIVLLKASVVLRDL